jgi:hypothetical protein
MSAIVSFMGTPVVDGSIIYLSTEKSIRTNPNTQLAKSVLVL